MIPGEGFILDMGDMEQVANHRVVLVRVYPLPFFFLVYLVYWYKYYGTRYFCSSFSCFFFSVAVLFSFLLPKNKCVFFPSLIFLASARLVFFFLSFFPSFFFYSPPGKTWERVRGGFMVQYVWGKKHRKKKVLTLDHPRFWFSKKPREKNTRAPRPHST